jgi:hypothetical protein
MIDLKEEVYNILNEKDSVLANSFLNKFRLVIGQTTEQEQLNTLSYFWSIELGSLPVDTISEREYMQTDVDYKTWLKRFKKHVLPTIISTNILK